MLRAMPPLIVPTFAVVPSSSRPKRSSASAFAAAAMALRPSSGAIPACAARPRNVASIVYCDGHVVTIPPTAAAWS